MFLVNLATLATRATLVYWLARENWTNLVIVAKKLALCSKAPVGHALQLTKGVCALKSVVPGTAVCI